MRRDPKKDFEAHLAAMKRIKRWAEVRYSCWVPTAELVALAIQVNIDMQVSAQKGAWAAEFLREQGYDIPEDEAP